MTEIRLIIATSPKILTESLLASALVRLDFPVSGDWLAPGTAWQGFITDINMCPRGSLRPFNQALRERLSDLPVDAACVTDVAGGYRMLAADMDKTMIDHECIDEMASVFGVGDKIAALTEQAMQGELDFTTALCQRVALLKGLPLDMINDLLAHRIRFMPGAEALISHVKQQGFKTLLVSGGFMHFAKPLGAKLGFDKIHANRLGVEGRQLNGELVGPIVDAKAKAVQVKIMAEQWGIGQNQIVAVGDGANDIPMIEAAGLGVAYQPKAALKAVADISLEHAGLNALSFFLGRDQNVPK